MMSALLCVLLGQTPAASEALRTQVMLDRAGFSPGVIDGYMGGNTRRALEAYQRQKPDLSAAAIEPTVSYVITPEDVSGPYSPDIPTDLVEQAKLPALGYRSVIEALSERFHATPALLQRLNPGATFAAGETLIVPNVEPLVPPVETLPTAPTGTDASAGRRGAAPARPQPIQKPDVVVTVTKSAAALTVTDASGRIVFFAPVTTGSEHDPLPIGEWKVNGVQLNPAFQYNPDLFWDADPAHSKATIPPGPNNPVGLVWIDISKDHYGLHGTPEPQAIGRTESHGCVRLTNWDALKLAGLVKPGTRVLFTE
jgi:lipoprotein-anchoring transpeptidase ErfK/SrfK